MVISYTITNNISVQVSKMYYLQSRSVLVHSVRRSNLSKSGLKLVLSEHDIQIKIQIQFKYKIFKIWVISYDLGYSSGLSEKDTCFRYIKNTISKNLAKSVEWIQQPRMERLYLQVKMSHWMSPGKALPI